MSNGIRQHTAYLSHVAAGTTGIYTFKAWDMNQCSCEGELAPRAMNRCTGGQYYRWGINTVAFGGSLIAGQKLPDDNDEWFITAGWPQALGTHAEVAGDAIVVHYAYTRQRMASGGKLDSHALLQNYSRLSAGVAASLAAESAVPRGHAMGHTPDVRAKLPEAPDWTLLQRPSRGAGPRGVESSASDSSARTSVVARGCEDAAPLPTARRCMATDATTAAGDHRPLSRQRRADDARRLALACALHLADRSVVDGREISPRGGRCPCTQLVSLQEAHLGGTTLGPF